MNQTLTYVSQDTIAALNEMVGGGFFLGYLATLEFSPTVMAPLSKLQENLVQARSKCCKVSVLLKTICKHSMPSVLKAQRK